MIRYLFAAAALVAFIGAVWNPPASAQLPVGTCVIEYVSTPTATGTKSTITCENRSKFQAPTPPAPAPIGEPCPATVSIPTIFAKAKDGTCLAVDFVVPPGFTASWGGNPDLQWWRDSRGNITPQTMVAVSNPGAPRGPYPIHFAPR